MVHCAARVQGLWAPGAAGLWLVGDKADGIKPWIVRLEILDFLWGHMGILSGFMLNESFPRALRPRVP